MPSHALPRRPPRWRVGAVLGALWGFCAALLLFKAVHVDDAAHLAIAQHITSDPLHPMRARVFWASAPAPAHELNQPHLFFYLLAGLLTASASIEALHLAMGAFTAAALYGTYRLVRACTDRDDLGLFAAAALGLGPALAPSQNLMTDVPLLALFVLSFAVLSTEPTSARRLVAAGSAIAAACLVKYTGLALLPIFAWWLWRHPRRPLWALGIPLAVLAAWSAFNVWDYGDVHLLGRRIALAEDAPSAPAAVGLAFGRSALFVLTLGAMAPFTLAFSARAAARFGGRRLILGGALGLAITTAGGQLLAAYGPEVLRGETLVHSFLRGLFFLNGALVIALAVSAARRLGTPVVRLLAAWAAGVSLFIVVLSPFVAVRHVLLVLPPVLGLLLVDPEGRPGPRSTAAALALSALLGLGVGVADWRIADAYRDLPARLEPELAGARRVLYLGHWGFQHYAEEAGWTPYVPGVTRLAPGDVLVRPRAVDQPAMLPADAARMPVRELVVLEASPLDLFRTVTPRLGYYSVWHGLPWTLSLAPLETVELRQAAQPSSPINGT